MSRAAVLAALGLALAAPAPVFAQIGLSSAPQSVHLSAVKQGWVSISLPGGAPVSPIDAQPVPVATSWNVDPARTGSVTLLARVDSGGGAIPASRLLGRSTGPVRGTILFTQPIDAANPIGTRTDGLDIRIHLPTSPGLPPGMYTGTLILVAITQ
jgi:hypothetical protein